MIDKIEMQMQMSAGHRVRIKTVPLLHMRRPQVSDSGVRPDGDIEITIARLFDERYEFLTALREYVWMMWRQAHDGMDARRAETQARTFADQIGQMTAAEIGVDWEGYQRAVAEVQGQIGQNTDTDTDTDTGTPAP